MKKSTKRKIKLMDVKKIRFAIEIEVEFPNYKSSSKLIDRNSMIPGWEIATDGSLDNGAEYRPTIKNKLYLNQETFIQLKEVLALVRVHRGRINHTCGLHVHVDCTQLSDKQVLEIIKEWVHKQDYIMKRFKVNPKRIDEYCKLLPRKNLQKITIAQIHKFRHEEHNWDFNPYSYLDDKYYSLNANHLKKGNYGTLEFRLFNGTKNFNELKERILFCLNFVKDACERN